jgi:hypothetical protein
MTLPMLAYAAIMAHRVYYGYQPVPIVGGILGIPELPGIKDVRDSRDARIKKESYENRLKLQRASADSTWRAFKTPSNYSSMSVETGHNDLSQSRVGRSLTSKPKTRGTDFPKSYRPSKPTAKQLRLMFTDAAKCNPICRKGYFYDRDDGLCKRID